MQRGDSPRICKWNSAQAVFDCSGVEGQTENTKGVFAIANNGLAVRKRIAVTGDLSRSTGLVRGANVMPNLETIVPAKFPNACSVFEPFAYSLM